MSENAPGVARLTACVRGDVQGVGYRFFARREASALGLRGYVRNLPDHSVEVVAEGERGLLQQFVGILRRGPSAAVVEAVDTTWSAAEGVFGGFQIRQ